MVEKLADSNQCVSCGKEMPEGNHVCKECLKKANVKPTDDHKRLVNNIKKN